MVLGDLSRHEQPDGPVLFHLDAPQLALRPGDLLGQPVALPVIDGLDTGDDEVRVLKDALDLAPNPLLQPLRPDVGLLPAAQAVPLHPAAHVVPAGIVGKVVSIDLAVSPVGGEPGPLRPEHHPALGAPEQVLQQVEHPGVPLGPLQPLLLELLRPVPRLLVHYRRYGDVYPRVPGLLVDLRPLFRQDLPGLSVAPDALVGRIRQETMDIRLIPPLPGLDRGDSFVHQLPSYGGRAHPFVNVHAEDAAHQLGRVLHHLRPAVVAYAVAVGQPARRYPPLLGRAALAHSSPLPEVVKLDLADGGHQAEGLHVDGVHDRLKAYLVGLHHLHEGGGWVHPPAEAVGLPADDGVEASAPGVGQHPLELRALLGPAPAHLLVAGGDGQPLALAVGFHLGGLLGYGVLVVPVLALVRYAGVDCRPLAGCLLLLCLGFRHDRLLCS